MNDDIVTRLHRDAEHCFISEHLLTYADAADEIERLRADVEHWRKLAHAEHYAWSQCPHDCVCMSNLYRKAKQDES